MLGILLNLLAEQVAGFFVFVTLPVEVHLAALETLVPVDLVTIKVRAVDAGELGLAADGEAAAAAHAGAVDHDRAHGNGGGDAVRLGGLGDELHHHGRADGEDLVILVAVLDELLERVGHETLFAVSAVVRHQLENAGDLAELILKDHKILALETDDRMDFRAAVVELLQNGVGDGTADTAADDADLLLALGLGRTAERADKVLKELAFGLVSELFGGGADRLYDDGDGALLPIVVVDGDGDSFTVFIDAQDDKLAGLGLLRYHRRLDLVESHGGLERFFFHDAIHERFLLFIRDSSPGRSERTAGGTE